MTDTLALIFFVVGVPYIALLCVWLNWSTRRLYRKSDERRREFYRSMGWPHDRNRGEM